MGLTSQHNEDCDENVAGCFFQCHEEYALKYARMAVAAAALDIATVAAVAAVCRLC